MDNSISSGVKATLTIKQSELGFVLNLLDALKLRGIVEFSIEKEPNFEPDFQQITAKALNEIIERSENSGDISLEKFKARHKL
ncbi:MAG: hypothetical protein HY842_19835 [Bacteroidetes bacterium]|nr:hypothetical protein [Bacteroidota bacterium]